MQSTQNSACCMRTISKSSKDSNDLVSYPCRNGYFKLLLTLKTVYGGKKYIISVTRPSELVKGRRDINWRTLSDHALLSYKSTCFLSSKSMLWNVRSSFHSGQIRLKVEVEVTRKRLNFQELLQIEENISQYRFPRYPKVHFLQET